LPTPDGPDRTVRRGRPECSADTELAFERRDLVGAQSADPAALRDADALHDLTGTYLPDPGHGLEEGGDLHLADHVVLLALLDDLGERGAGMLEPVLDLGTFAAGGSGLLQGSGALLGGERRKGATC
jgi:hypothetical protein